MSTEQAIRDVFVSPNVSDSNMEPANLVDVVANLAYQTGRIANAVRPPGVAAGNDDCGGHVDSLTEAVMGITTGLCEIASSIRQLADAVRERQ